METKKAAQTATSEYITVQSPYEETSHQKLEMIILLSMGWRVILILNLVNPASLSYSLMRLKRTLVQSQRTAVESA